MIIFPAEKLSDIPTGNKYIGNNGFVNLGPNLSTLDVAEFFQFHPVSLGWRPASKNITSHILEKQIRVFYAENNMISEIEVLKFEPKIPNMKITKLMLGQTNLFEGTLITLKSILEDDGFELIDTNVGFDTKDGSVCFYSSKFEGNLNVDLESVCLKFF